MASKGIEMVMTLVLVVVLCRETKAQSGCTNALIGMSSCLNYITGNSSSPSSSCCSQLGKVVQSQPQCLCSVLNGGGASLGVTINQTLALALPGACNVQTPPISQCNGGNGSPTTSATTPAASPEGSPDGSSDALPEDPTSPSDTPSGSGSKTTPSTNGSSSDGSNIKAPLHLLVFVLFMVSCVSTATRF